MKKIKVDVYGATVRFFTDHAAYQAALKAADAHDPDADANHEPYGETFRVNTWDYLAGVFDNNPRTAAHEAVHLCFRILKDADINPMDDSGEEAFAYLHEYLWHAMTTHMARPRKPPAARPPVLPLLVD